jgi:hypothetical protein
MQEHVVVEYKERVVVVEYKERVVVAVVDVEDMVDTDMVVMVD